MRRLHFVVPDSVHDPGRPSGGNTYDRRVAAELAALGWTVEEQLVPGRWPEADEAGARTLADVASDLGDGDLVVVDGIIASLTPEVMVPLSRRVALAVLVHLPLDGPREQSVLSAAAAVITTSTWARDRVLDLHGLDPVRVHVAEPGVERAAVAPGSQTGGQLLCVAAVTPDKGQDVLVTALASLTTLSWRCVCAGPLDRDPGFAARVSDLARRTGVADRVQFVGPLDPVALEQAYAAADVLVHPSRLETYGMVVTEALAHGLPVVAASVGGIPEAVGHAHPEESTAPEDDRPGLLVPPGDAPLLAAALRRWLTDPALRSTLRRRAAARRLDLRGWSRTGAQVGRVLEALPRV